jgi:mannonate dehydratase
MVAKTEMRIKEIQTIMTSTAGNYLIVKIITDSNIVGYGDASLNGRELAVKTTIDEYLSPWLVGHDADKIEEIWQMIFRHTYWRGGPVFMTALAGIDMALWDVKGKHYNAPVYSLLGGKSRDRVKAYMHVHGKTDEELIKRSLKKVKSGCETIRYSFDIQNPFDPNINFKQPHQDTELGRIEIDAKDVINQVGIWDSEVYMNELIRVTGLLRKKLGSYIGLIHDVHGRLNPKQAARVAKELEPYKLYFLEDPVEPMQKKHLSLIRNYSITPLAMGELYTNIYECIDPIQNQWIDYLRVDISHFGGITAIKKAADLADLYGIKTAFHGPTDISPIAYAAMMQVDFVVPNFGIQEYAYHGDQTFKVFKTEYFYDKGYLYIDNSPGLGVEFDEIAANKFPYKPKFLPGLRDKEGAIHNW